MLATELGGCCALSETLLSAPSTHQAQTRGRAPAACLQQHARAHARRRTLVQPVGDRVQESVARPVVVSCSRKPTSWVRARRRLLHLRHRRAAWAHRAFPHRNLERRRVRSVPFRRGRCQRLPVPPAPEAAGRGTACTPYIPLARAVVSTLHLIRLCNAPCAMECAADLW